MNASINHEPQNALPKKAIVHFPLFVGLFFSLWLAIVCNSYLDISLGGFGVRAIYWALIIAFSLRIGWQHRFSKDPQAGKKAAIVFIFIGVVLSLFVFLPRYDMPEVAVLFIVFLQMSQNCLPLTQGRLNTGLLVSGVVVMYATMDYRSDWTLLFYSLPCFIAILYTIISDQSHQRMFAFDPTRAHRSARADNAQHPNPATPPKPRGQGLATFSASLFILSLCALFYAITPQFHYSLFDSEYGQLALSDKNDDQGQQGKKPRSGKSGKNGGSGNGDGGGVGGGGGEGNTEGGGAWSEHIDAIRSAAQKPQLPDWQKGAMNQLANGLEKMQGFAGIMQKMIDWLKLLMWLIAIALFLLLLLWLLYKLLRWMLSDFQLVLWLRTRWDYALIERFNYYSRHDLLIIACYNATQRLMRLDVVKEYTQESTMLTLQERLHINLLRRPYFRHQLIAISSIYETLRFGKPPENLDSLQQKVRLAYRYCYRLAG